MKTILITLFLLLLPFLILAQSSDSTAAVLQIDSLIQHCQTLARQQKYDEALEVIERAEGQAAEAFGKNHPSYADCVFYHAFTLYSMGGYEQAEALYLEAVAVRKEILGKEHEDYAMALRYLALVYHEMGNYGQAEALYLKTRLIYEKLGKEHPDYAATLRGLANLYQAMGSYDEAEAFYLEAKAISEDVLGKEHPEYPSCLSDLARLYRKTGNYEQAETLLLEAKAIEEKILGKDHPSYIATAYNLGILYWNMGSYERAEPFYKEARDFYEKTLGKEHPRYAVSTYNLAILSMDLNKHEQAETLFMETKAIQEKTLGKGHPQYAKTLSALGGFYTKTGKYEQAEAFILESKAIREKVMGKDHPSYTESVGNLGVLYMNMGEYEQAEPFLEEVKDGWEKFLGKEHIRYEMALGQLATAYLVNGKYEQAEPLYVEWGALQRKLLLQATRHVSEEELASYTDHYLWGLKQIFSFGQISPFAGVELKGLCFDHALFYKGFLLHTSNQVRRLVASDPASAERYALLQSCHRQLAGEYAKPPVARQGVAELEEKANALEKELVRTVAGFGQAIRQVTWQEVQAKLKPGEAAIEFVHYQFANPAPTDSIMYAAILLRRDGESPKFIPLFEGKEIQALLQGEEGQPADYLNGLYSYASRGVEPRKGPHRTLFELNWQPLERELENIHTIYYAPSGLLHRLNFAALSINEQETLADKYKLVQLRSTRQLAVLHPETEEDGGALLFGGIQYELDSAAIAQANAGYEMEGALAARGSWSIEETDRNLRANAWQYLPWTEKEVAAIAPILKSVQAETIVKTGYAATEEAFRQTGQGKASPRVLHLATHGFFFPDIALPNSPEGGEAGVNSLPSGGIFQTSDNPMIRSGLILAGGNYAWQGNPPIENMEDGILTAYEISQMDLSNTELVVLSACETGLGDIEGNEGVYGLQRAFKIAGARYLVMSLWQVPDRETMEFMQAFYHNWLEEEKSIPDAFRATQREMREKYEDPYYWAAFVLLE